jgi:hypothetical protein
VKREENGRTCKERKEAEENLFLQTENREKVSSAKVAGGGEGVLLSSDAVPRDLAKGTLVPSELAEFSVVALVEGAFEVAKLVVVEAIVYGKRGSVERDEGGEGRVRTLVVKLLVVVLVVLLLVVVVLLVVVLLIVVCGREKSQRERLGCQRERAYHRSPSCHRLLGKRRRRSACGYAKTEETADPSCSPCPCRHHRRSRLREGERQHREKEKKRLGRTVTLVVLVVVLAVIADLDDVGGVDCERVRCE